jgi:hypothetical protein
MTQLKVCAVPVKIGWSKHRKGAAGYYIYRERPTRYLSATGEWYSVMSLTNSPVGGTYFPTREHALAVLAYLGIPIHS